MMIFQAEINFDGLRETQGLRRTGVHKVRRSVAICSVTKQSAKSAQPLIDYHNDHLGTPQVMTSSTGAVVWKATYNAFGNATLIASTIINNLRFPGQYYDAETGLHYNWNRYYDPNTGRYLTPDPIGLEGGVNLFSYTGSDPVNWIDPWGLKTWMCTKPLDAIGDKGAESGTRSGPDIWGNPLYHQYICVGQKNSPTCGGQSSRGKPYAPGVPSHDKYDADRCKEKQPDNDCLENCLRKKFAGPRPYYGLIGPGTNCQEWTVRDVHKIISNFKDIGE